MSLTIGDPARATGTKVETVRYYERIGLMPRTARTVCSYRAYGREHGERLSFIRRARALGFSIEQAREPQCHTGKIADCRIIEALSAPG